MQVYMSRMGSGSDAMRNVTDALCDILTFTAVNCHAFCCFSVRFTINFETVPMIVN